MWHVPIWLMIWPMRFPQKLLDRLAAAEKRINKVELHHAADLERFVRDLEELAKRWGSKGVEGEHKGSKA